MIDMFEATVLSGLVTFIIVFFLKDLDGPDGIFLEFRVKILHYDDEGLPVGFITELFQCHWCMATWFSIPATLFAAVLYPADSLFTKFIMIMFCWLASIAISGLIYTIVNR